MKNYFYKCLDFLFYSNVFVALCNVAQALVTYSFLGIKPSIAVCLFLFFTTLIIYNFSLFICKPSTNLNPQHKRFNWFFKYIKFNIGITIFACWAIIPLFFGLNYGSKILVIFLGAISISYLLPVIYVGNKWRSLRSIYGLKLFLIAFVWALSVVLLPVYQTGNFIPERDVFILISKQLLLFMAITVPFDVRDFFEDKASNLKTLPIIYGVNKAYRFAIIILIVNLALVFCFKIKVPNADFFSSVITPILAGYVILKSSLRKNQYHYFLHLDGILILQYLFLLLFKLIL